MSLTSGSASSSWKRTSTFVENGDMREVKNADGAGRSCLSA